MRRGKINRIMRALVDGEVPAAVAAQTETRDPITLAAAVDRARQTSSMRVALLLGFAVVFALWLVWGYQLVQNFQHIEDNVESLQRNYVRGEQALSRVRTTFCSAPSICAMP